MLTFGVLKIPSRMLRGRCGHVISRRNRSRTWRVDWRFQGWVRVTASYHGSGKVLEGTQTHQVACTMVSRQTSVHPQSDPLTVWFIPALRVEWAKSRAQALRWSEEVLLLKEEMHRVPAYFEYKASWWVERSDAEGREASPALAEGLHAYAESQAKLLQDLAMKFNKKWAKGLAGENDNEGVIAGAGVESDDELDGTGTGSGEEAMEEADEEDEGIANDKFTSDN